MFRVVRLYTVAPRAWKVVARFGVMSGRFVAAALFRASHELRRLPLANAEQYNDHLTDFTLVGGAAHDS